MHLTLSESRIYVFGMPYLRHQLFEAVGMTVCERRPLSTGRAEWVCRKQHVRRLLEMLRGTASNGDDDDHGGGGTVAGGAAGSSRLQRLTRVDWLVHGLLSAASCASTACDAGFAVRRAVREDEAV